MASRADALKALPLFGGLSGKDREIIARCMDELSFAQGATLISEGRTNHTFFVLVDGEVDVDIAGQPRRTLRRGDFFGEISMQHRIPATATVVARTPVDVFIMSHEQFGALCVSPDVVARLQAAINDRLIADRRAISGGSA
ncbi:MAG: cyclic nucleotide-binding domain-containing protein [Chloroflexi bacterium]|nr:cyclic nucleotide-binding domain-containing protein [Chloroflexota bacterium]MBV9597406.1 cyclic nucleotide-binding domain-containing protein [Chloroflexota bacterium]